MRAQRVPVYRDRGLTDKAECRPDPEKEIARLKERQQAGEQIITALHDALEIFGYIGTENGDRVVEQTIGRVTLAILSIENEIEYWMREIDAARGKDGT